MPCEAPVITATLEEVFMVNSKRREGPESSLRNGAAPTRSNLGAACCFANPRVPADILPRGEGIQPSGYGARSANAARKRGSAKSTKARTLGTDRRPCG